jgi:ABC-2 type transport system ATP-binding protein
MDQVSVHRPRFTLGPLSFPVAAGERLALVGPNGAGKSTTMNVLAGRLPAYTGHVWFEGQDLRTMLPEARARLGMLPEQVPAYQELTVREHFDLLRVFHPRWDDRLATDLIERLRVDPGQRISKLSKGTRVKVGFIGAEAIQPDVLLLDEPTSGLDPVIRGELLDVIDERLRECPGRVLLFSTHILEDIARVADRVLLIHEGRLIEDQPIAAFASAEGSTAQALYERIRSHA